MNFNDTLTNERWNYLKKAPVRMILKIHTRAADLKICKNWDPIQSMYKLYTRGASTELAHGITFTHAQIGTCWWLVDDSNVRKHEWCRHNDTIYTLCRTFRLAPICLPMHKFSEVTPLSSAGPNLSRIVLLYILNLWQGVWIVMGYKDGNNLFHVPVMLLTSHTLLTIPELIDSFWHFSVNIRYWNVYLLPISLEVS